MLLTGLLYWGTCGARTSLETGKGRRCRYYNCSACTRKGRSACLDRRVAQEDHGRAVLEHLSDRLFTANRVRGPVKQLASELGKLRRSNSDRVSALQAKLQDVKVRIRRQYEAIESAAVDITLVADHLRELTAEEAELTDKIDDCQGPPPLPLCLFREDSLRSIQANVVQQLRLPSGAMAKRYLSLSVKRIEVEGKEVRIETNLPALLEGGIRDTHEGAATRGWKFPQFGQIGSP